MSMKKRIRLIILSIVVIIAISLSTFIIKNSNKDNVDITSPIIVLDDVYAVKTGYNKSLTDTIMSADDVDKNPTREIIGDYDLDKEGKYNLTYKIEDESGNSATKDFTLKVKDNYTYKEEKIDFQDAIKNYKTESTKIGIDVSKWQSDIDWEKVAKEGVEFTIIRMAYQNGFDGELLTDPYFEQNVKGCMENNIPVAIYFSSYAKTAEEAKQQADWICQYLVDNSYKNLSIAFDWENWNSFNTLGISLTDINTIANSFMDEIQNLGYKSILYSSKTYLEAVWENPNNYPVWLANYVTKTTYENPYKIWQFCQTGIINGISGYVDINVMY